MVETSLVERLTDEILARLSPEKLWEMAFNCRTVCIEKDANRIRFIVECGAERIGMAGSLPGLHSELARFIDHTLLKPTATGQDIDKLCAEAVEYGFATVCVNPVWVKRARRGVAGSSVKVCSVVGFPLGANTTEVKEFEARRAVFDGASEIDMVINVGAVKGGDLEAAQRDVAGVVASCHEADAICKVILETAFLNEDEKVAACRLAKDAGADFVKTSTGFGPGGATAEDVALMRRVVGPSIGVKAAGGIRDSAATRRMLEAGATRIGASAGVRIVGEAGDGQTSQQATA